MCSTIWIWISIREILQSSWERQARENPHCFTVCPGWTDRLPAQVSGGEAQRGAIARAVINSPGILFADEPTGALNRRNTQDVLDLLTELNVEGQSILMVTHDVRAAIRANRIIYIEDGRIIGELKLSQYIEEDRKSRESQIDAWLGSMQW